MSRKCSLSLINEFTLGFVFDLWALVQVASHQASSPKLSRKSFRPSLKSSLKSLQASHKQVASPQNSESSRDSSPSLWLESPSLSVTMSIVATVAHLSYCWALVLTRMWADAQCDGRPAKYRWRPLFNAVKFGWCPLLECRAVTPLRHETRWNLQGCPKLTNRSQPLVGRSSPYEDMWKRYRCLTSFFPIVDTWLSCEDTARQSCPMVPKWRFFASCIFSELRAAHFRHAF